MLGSLVAAAALQSGLVGQQLPKGTLPPPPPDNEFNRVSDTWLNFEVSPISPIQTVSTTWAVMLNAKGLKVEIVHLPSGQTALSLPIGPGVTAARLQPLTATLWTVDSVNGCVSLVDLAQLNVVRTIRVGGTPHAIEFDGLGTRAYVSCASTGEVRVLRTSDGAIVNTIQTGVDEPRAMAVQGGKVWVAPFFSGNDTTVARLDDDVLPDPISTFQVVKASDLPGATPLPDVDLVSITMDPLDAGADFLTPAEHATGLGTILLNMRARLGTDEVWVPNIDSLNGDFEGEVNFPAGQVVRNRVTIVDTTDLANPVVVDLDAISPPDVTCAQPTDVAFDEVRQQAYVTGYSNDVVAVLDLTQSPPTWKGHYSIPAIGTHAGPRNVSMGTAGKYAFVFNNADNSYTRIDLSLPIGAPGALSTHPIGYDPTPADVKHGRGVFNDATLSKSGTSACNSCHVDGHLDKLVWDLSSFLDPEGTEDPIFDQDRKGPQGTQSMRGIEETGPFHWRGERATLTAFDVTFPGLFEHEVAGEPSKIPEQDFADLEEYIRSLVYRPNPFQNRDRTYSPQAQSGHDLFVADLLAGVDGCAVCHELPLATNGEILREHPGVELAPSVQVAQLRGIFEKHPKATHDLGAGFGEVATTGLGILHDARFPDLPSFLDGAFDLTDPEEDDLLAFLREFDTGISPAGAWQVTVHASNAATFYDDELAWLLQAADEGQCDVVLTTKMLNVAGTWVAITGAYDRDTGMFQLPWEALGQFTAQQFIDLAPTPWGATTFHGLPPGMGWRWGVDWDNDGLYNMDELLWATGMTNPDSDHDGFPDGHEVDNGTLPTVPDATTLDDTIPTVGDVTEIYVNTNTTRLEFTTPEPAKAVIRVLGSDTVLVEGPRSDVFAVHHSMVVGDLNAGESVDLEIEVTDPSGFSSTKVHTVTTDDVLQDFVVRVGDLDIDVTETQSGLTLDPVATVRVSLIDRSGAPLDDGFGIQGFLYYREGSGPWQVLNPFKGSFTDANGVSEFLVFPPDVTLPSAGADPPERFLVYGVREIYNPADDPDLPDSSYVEALDIENFLVERF